MSRVSMYVFMKIENSTNPRIHTHTHTLILLTSLHTTHSSVCLCSSLSSKLIEDVARNVAFDHLAQENLTLINIKLSTRISQQRCVCISVYVYPLVCPSVRLSICLPVCASVRPSVRLSIFCLSVCLSVRLSLYLSTCPSFCLPVFMFVYMSVHLSNCSIYLIISAFVFVSLSASSHLSRNLSKSDKIF